MKIFREHDKKFATKKKMEIEMAPEFHEFFRKTETISSKFSSSSKYLEESGRFSQLLKNSRKRKHHEIEEDKVPEDLDSLKELNAQKDQTIQELKEMISKFQIDRLGFIEDQEKLEKFYDLGGH